MTAAGWVRVAHGSFGSRNGQPWSRELATAKARAAPSDTSAGAYGAVVAPSKDALRAAIAAQTCPWCGRGPFKVLALHTNKEHGVDRIELRQLADLNSKSSVCSPETSVRARDSLAARNADGSLSVKGGQAAAERGIHFLGARVQVEKLSAANKARDESIVSDYRSGLGREEIASRNATGTAVVARVLSSAGILEDGRKQAAKKRDIGDRLKKASADATERATQGKINRYLELGGDWPAIHHAADEFSVSAKSFAALMRKRGVHVPDGRK